MVDYRMLIRLEPSQLSEALWRLSPPLSSGRRARWVLVLLDIAITDYYPVNEDPDVNPTMRIWFASRLLDFIDRELEVPNWHQIAHWYVAFARKAIEDGVRDLPQNLQADYIVGRALECFALTRDQALQVAEKEREHHLDALAAGLEGEEFSRAAHVEGAGELNAIRLLLSDVRWFQGRVVDTDLAAELDSWLGIYSDLGLGDAVAQLLAQRIRVAREDL
ncbi:hypothetical protein [Streptomyces sp. HGB0020]|jgi:hypothetical protein|uniref:hypothetical protein n=1 Tax=Streptomyces sp. HGB0020 TaxID=1078086 RepID=UPI0003A1F8D7|nr:hypothetical protein [Streptomyces sp. HGB0020]